MQELKLVLVPVGEDEPQEQAPSITVASYENFSLNGQVFHLTDEGKLVEGSSNPAIDVAE